MAMESAWPCWLTNTLNCANIALSYKRAECPLVRLAVALLGECRDVRVVAGEEGLQSSLRSFVRGCCREIKYRGGISLRIIGPGIEQVHLSVFFPLPPVIEAAFSCAEPSFDTRVRRLDSHPVVVDALLNPIELAFDRVLRLLGSRHGIALECFKPAVNAVELDAKVAAKPVDVLTHKNVPDCLRTRPLAGHDPAGSSSTSTA